MHLLRSIGLCVAVLVLAPAFVAATTGEYVQVQCPVCANTFEGWEIASTNVMRVDTDFCEHGGGDAPVMLDTWTCPACGYSGDAPDFDAAQVPKALLETLRAHKPLKPPVPLDRKLRRTTGIPSWARKDLQLQVLALRTEVSARRRFWVAMRAAWTQRFGIEVPEALRKAFKALPPPHHLRPEDAHPLDERGDDLRGALARERDALDAALPLNAEQRRHGLLEAVVLLKARGEDPDASRILATLRKAHPVLPEAEEALARDLAERLGRERHYLELAVPLHEKVIADRAWDSEGAGEYDCRYLLGELQRKLGRDEEARRTLLAVKAEPSAPEVVVEWVDRSLARMARGR